MINRANSLEKSPEFYNTFTSNCTNNIMQNTKIPAWQSFLDPRIILPGYSDQIAYEYGVLDQDYSLDVIREAAHIQKDKIGAEDNNFYSKIRQSYFNKLASNKSL